MNSTRKKYWTVRKVTTLALFSALVLILQLLGGFIRFGMFSVSLVLIPIVLGAAFCGTLAGGWLGLVFGLAVLISGDAGAFLAVNPFGTVVTVLLKGILAGLCAGVVYRLLARWNVYVGVLCAAAVCPIVNTGVFLSLCTVFFMPTIREWAASFGYENVGVYMILGLVGGNFLFELLFNIVLSPAIVRLLHAVHLTEEPQ